VCDDEADVLATADYGYEFDIAACRGNVVGIQFHPEKSHRYDRALLRDLAAGCVPDTVPAAARSALRQERFRNPAYLETPSTSSDLANARSAS
jgi:hypothetical protein